MSPIILHMQGQLRSLSLKVALLLAVAVGATMLGATVIGVTITGREIESQVKQRALEAAQDLKQNIEQLPLDADEAAIEGVMKRAVERHRKLIDNFVYLADPPPDVGGDQVEIKVALGDEKDRLKRTKRPPKAPRPKPPKMTKVQIRTDGGVAWALVPAASQPARAAAKPAASQPVLAGGRAPATQPRGRDAARLAAAASQPAIAAPAPRPRPAPRPTRVHVKNPSVAGDARTIEFQMDLDPPGPSNKATLTTTASLEPVDRLTHTHRTVSLEVGLVFIVVIAGVALFISNQFVGKPLRQIAVAMGVVERGDMTRRVLVKGHDEIGTLATGFNRMVTELARADGEIRAFNSLLAEKVREATRDLREKHQALEHVNRLLLETRRELGDKERLAALGQLAAQLAHEVGTPLSSVSGHVQLALADRGCPPALRERLEVATGELGRVSKVIRDYLDSTRPLAPAPRLVNLRQLSEEAAEIAALARGDLRKAETSIAPELETIRTDGALLRQILLNLLANAHDAAGEQGRVSITGTLEDGHVVIRVADDGPGIAPEDRARIFEPFYTTKGRGRGTGLGLSICRELTRALGGRVAVESEVGRGSTFIVSLPSDTVAAASEPSGSGRVVATAREESGRRGREIPS